MNDSDITALVFLAIGMIMIFIGLVGIYRKKTNNKPYDSVYRESDIETPPSGSKRHSSNEVIDKMKADKKLQEKIRGED